MRTLTRRRLLTTAASAASAAGLTAVPVRAADRTHAGADDLVAALRALPGLRVIEERPGAEPGYRFFVLGLRQPVDHNDPGAGTFEQRLTLLHTAADRPTVLFSTGYEVPLMPRRTEPAVLLGGNQLGVEHRFFGTSRPAALDLTHLTIRQAADDHHRVVRLFRLLYPGAWISTGGSKGGMASVYHRRFHPHDVDGTVAYSAPNNVDDREDSAYIRFLEHVGTAAARDALKTAQRQMLLRRTHLVARYEAWAAATHDTFRIIGSADKALEIAVLRVPFMFWQNHTAADAPAIPGPDASTDVLYAWLEETAALPVYADSTARNYIPYWYQLGTQMGYLSVPTDHLDGLLQYPDGIEPRSFVPRDVPMHFDAEAMPDIDRWVRRRASRLLFVNGTQDPSVAEPFRPGPRDARVLWVPGGNHHVSIADLSPADRAEAVTALRRWATGSG
ncbi:aminopeptidase [Streptomyces sp. NBC_01352]|uniref:S28 family serine protease n=1 Tax=unclassified Streptomyces TaxID=2593676 RepID=UPI002254AFA1|nr:MULTISPECIES: S28 family serine protease [unclassified Streptomyces]MCX4703679.1 S28 family serine protease [Streptomyces sp. NBC_01373]